MTSKLRFPLLLCGAAALAGICLAGCSKSTSSAPATAPVEPDIAAVSASQVLPASASQVATVAVEPDIAAAASAAKAERAPAAQAASVASQ
jgi:hypothetical protein